MMTTLLRRGRGCTSVDFAQPKRFCRSCTQARPADRLCGEDAKNCPQPIRNKNNTAADPARYVFSAKGAGSRKPAAAGKSSPKTSAESANQGCVQVAADRRNVGDCGI